jgi:hypothetical protein
MKRVQCMANLFAVAAIGLAALIYTYPPERYGFYPACPIYHYTRFLCPGCGATRAVAALLHGNLAVAWNHNALFVCVVPILMMEASRAYWSAVAKGRVEWLQVPKSAIALFSVIALVFTIVRNL